MPSTFVHFVFVDFENVPEVDLGLVAGKLAHVTLLIGKNQKKLDLSLVQQMRRVHDQVELVEVGASGHNALDLTLAYYLGQAVQQDPAAQFSVVSKDKDFEPMIAHLTGKGLKVVRCDSFAAVFQSSPKKPAIAAAFKPSATGKVVVPAKTVAMDDRYEKLYGRLKNNSAPRPKRKSSLLAHISTAFGGRLPEAEQNDILDKLVSRGVLTIDSKGKVSYP